MFRLLCTCLILFQINAFSQFQIKGKVKDANTGEPIPNATIEVINDKSNSAVSDEHGNFSITGELMDTKSLVLVIRHLGYENYSIQINQELQSFILVNLIPSTVITEEVIVRATRAQEKLPITFSLIEKPTIRQQNFGQDMPFVLQFTPSVVSTSDAGTGIGYTGIRIRGSDATRINVTINGIPYNDSESQGVFWVDIPDIATSSQSIQIQRGIGTSGNGAGAFGATINLQTNTLNNKPYAELIQSVGSFNTSRTTFGLGSGKLKNNFSFDGRISKINSEGFIDRASADLSSYYASAGYYGSKTIIKAIFFGGWEKTYQSWYGVPESRLKNDRDGMFETALTEGWNDIQLENLLNSGSRTFNFYTYKNQVDDYDQHHSQIHLSKSFNSNLTGNLAFHYTRGKGYYEEFKDAQSADKYGVSGALPEAETDLVKRRWLDNHFYGTTWSLQWQKEKTDLLFGGAWNFYDGDHYGEIIQVTIPDEFPPLPFRYYFNNGKKMDLSVYLKSSYALSRKLFVFGDIQFRGINYRGLGTESEQEIIDFTNDYNFFNPKFGVTWEFKERWQWYSSLAIASREPVRNDIIDAINNNEPKPEKLSNLEIGVRHKSSNVALQANYYLMDYKNQLVLTGELNDVGANVRINVSESFRSGIELEADLKFNPKLRWLGNLTLSRNKIREFEEILYDYGDNFDQLSVIRNKFRNTDISFSPAIIGGSQFSWKAIKNLEMIWLSKYVSDQFLDNTSNRFRKIDDYFLNDLRFTWHPTIKNFDEVSISISVANIFNKAYESNGYTYGFLGGQTTYRQNFYYPQAGRNFLVMLTLKL